jgi:arabinogalactan oligomer/maltooligosaccharide transport system permease protein
MSAATQKVPGGAQAPPGAAPTGILSLLLRILALALIDGITIWLVYQMVFDGYVPLAATLALVTIWVNVVFLSGRFYPLRYVAPGLSLMVIMVLYPILFTFYVSFTNYGTGHLVTKEVAIEVIESQTFLPADATVYRWTAYKNPAGQYKLWLVNPDDPTEVFTVVPGEEPVARTGEPPAELDGFTQIPTNQLFGELGALSSLTFGVKPDSAFQVSQTSLGQAARFEQQYVYDPAQDAMIDQQTGEVFFNVNGTFTAESGKTLTPGFAVTTGLSNYQRLFTDPTLSTTFLQVFLWTVIFALMSVFLTFVLGMFLAIVFDVPEMPLRAPLRSLLLIPYTIPAFVAVPVWVGLLNPQFGVVSQMIATFTGGWVPAWFSDPFWAKVGILLIQTWLGFPYMFVVVTGALQTLPNDIYEAADLDGANAWAKFRTITLPLLLVTVGPLLVASFAFNFNNFVVINLYNQGRPAHAERADAGRLHRHSGDLHLQHRLRRPGHPGLWLCVGHHDDDLLDPVRHHAIPVPLHQHAGRERAQCLTKDVSPLRSVRCSAANASPSSCASCWQS